jgi:hypothetical protein
MPVNVYGNYGANSLVIDTHFPKSLNLLGKKGLIPYINY